MRWSQCFLVMSAVYLSAHGHPLLTSLMAMLCAGMAMWAAHTGD